MTRRQAFAHLLAHASTVWGMPESNILAKGKRREVSWARQALAWWLVKEHGFGIAETGRLFRQDHTTVLHGVNRVERMKDTDDHRWQMVVALLDVPAPPMPTEFDGSYLRPLTVTVAYSFVTYEPVKRPAPVPPPVIRRTPKLLATPIREAA